MAKIVNEYTEITIDDLVNNKLPKGVLLWYKKHSKIPSIIKIGKNNDTFKWVNMRYNEYNNSEFSDIQTFIREGLDIEHEFHWFETEEEAIKFMASRLD